MDVGGADEVLAQPYVQIGDPVTIPGLAAGTYNNGALDNYGTTFAAAFALPSGAIAVSVFANAATGAAPSFALAATLSVAGSAGNPGPYVYTALSHSGLTCAVASELDGGGAGILAVFTRPSVSGQAWTQVATVHGDAGSLLGASVSMSANGSVIAVGVLGANGGVGAARVYNFNYTTGSLVLAATLSGADVAGAPQQGWSVCLSGDGLTLAVGGPYDDNLYGAVWIFKRTTAAAWVQIGQKLAPQNAVAGDALIGSAVALSFDGTVLAIGAQDNSVVQRSGCVFMYTLAENASSRVQGQTIYPLGTVDTNTSVFFVRLSDDGAVLAFDQFSNNNTQGGVFVYNRQADGVWVQNSIIRVPVSAVFNTPSPGFILAAMSANGSAFAVINVNANPTSTFTIFQ